MAGRSSGSQQQCQQGAAIPPRQCAAPVMAPGPALYLQFVSEDLVPATTYEGEAQQLLDAIFGPWPFLPDGCRSGDLQQQLVVAHFQRLLQPLTEEALRQLTLPPDPVQPGGRYKPPFLHWLMVPHRCLLYDLGANVSGCTPLDPELQIRLVAAVWDHLGEEAFNRLLCEKDMYRANAVHRACAMSEPLFVFWLLGVRLSEDRVSAADSAPQLPPAFPPSPRISVQALLACSLHGWLPLHDACRHRQELNVVACIRALEVAFGGNR